jgi:hypothetical protein
MRTLRLEKTAEGDQGLDVERKGGVSVGSVWAVNAGSRRQVHAESADSAHKVCVVGKPEI